MLRILGSRRTLCDGLSRRDLLRIGGLGMGGAALGGFGLADLLRGAEAPQTDGARPASFGRAKSIILIHLYGSPSQLEWADMKPNAPVEIRGEFGGIASTLPGCDVCELLPNMARVMDRTTVIRSMTHPYPIHGVAYALTGVPAIDVAMELSPNDPKHWPYFGSVVDYIDAQRAIQSGGAQADNSQRSAVPRNLALPYRFSSRRTGEVPRAGPFGAFLGSQFNPVWTDYIGEAHGGLPMELGELRFNGPDPYVGLSRDSYFEIPAATSLPPAITLDRLDHRRNLLAQLDAARAELERTGGIEQHDRYQQMAFSLLTSDGLRAALDPRHESDAMRESYGLTLFGQSCLAARRLVEAGGRVISVFWDEYGLAGHAWDTHYDHFRRMREVLCPGLDRAWHGLITDLEQRGLLDETLVVCTSEHGRTPQIHNGGRDHWSRVYTTMLAGAGIKRGCVVGASDSIGGDVKDRPVSPKDLLATMYHLLGIDHRTIIRDALDRPLPLVDGEVVHEVLA